MPEINTTPQNNEDTFAVTLVRIPGPGAGSVTLQVGATLADLVHQQGLQGRNIFLNGEGVEPTNLSSVSIGVNDEVFATGTVKGN